MTRKYRLIQEARESIKFRGHIPARFHHDERGAYYKCRCCEATIAVIPRPLPNQCELMGEALAVHCIGSQLAMYREDIERYGKIAKWRVVE